MVFGMPFGSPFGLPEECITFARCDQIKGTTHELGWTVADECDGYYQVAIDGFKKGLPIYCVAGIETTKIVNIPLGLHSIEIICLGQFADGSVRISDELDYYKSKTGRGQNSIQASIATVRTLIIQGDNGQLSNLSLAGLQRHRNIATVESRPSWGKFDVTLTTVDGVHTLELAVNGSVLISGSRTGDGTFDLKGAGVTGSVDLTYSADIAGDCEIFARWPLQLRAYVKPSTFIAGDFATRTVTNKALTSNVATLTSNAHQFVVGQAAYVDIDDNIFNGSHKITSVTTNTFSYPVTHANVTSASCTGTANLATSGIIDDDGVSNQYTFRSWGIETSGTYYVVIHQLGDDANESTSIQGGGLAVTTSAIPNYPTDLIFTGLYYFDGTHNLPVVSWDAPSGGADSYNLYDSGSTGIVDFTQTPVNVGTSTNHNMPWIGAYTGTRYIWVRAVKDGIEEQNLNLLQLNYVSGNIIATRPPNPVAGSHYRSFKRTLIVPISVFLDPNLSTPTTAELYIYTPAAGVNYATPAATVTLPVGQSGNAITAEITGTVSSDDLYYFQVRTFDADGVNSNNVNEYGPVELTLTAMPEPEFIVDTGA